MSKAIFRAHFEQIWNNKDPISDRQLVEEHANADTLGLLQQIGIAPEAVMVPPFFF